MSKRADYKSVLDRGIELLDQHVPEWRERIDLKTFDWHNRSTCVFGQVFCRGTTQDRGWAYGEQLLFPNGPFSRNGVPYSMSDCGFEMSPFWHGGRTPAGM